jgi:hypothetical protein
MRAGNGMRFFWRFYMKDLRAEANKNPPRGENAAASGADAERLVRDLGGKSEGELMNELVAAVARERGAGNLKNADLDDFAARTAAFLPPEQAARMRELIKGLKN